MVTEANIERQAHGLVPSGEGWYVLNAQDATWYENDEFGRACTFEGSTRFPSLGVNIQILNRGQPNCMYHGEDEQEDFLVLSGECLLLVEGQERRLRAWDFVHCPPWTEHVFVGVTEEPCTILMLGTRTPQAGVRYPVNELALRHGAGVEVATTSAEGAYGRISQIREVRYRDGDL